MGNESDQLNIRNSLFEPFTWLTDKEVRGGPDFAEKVKDITLGIGQALQMIEKSELDFDAMVTPVLNHYQQGVFMRLAIASIKLLHDEAEQQIESRNKRGREI